MNRIFTEEEINLLIEALEQQEADINDEIIEAEEINAANSIIFAYSSELMSVKMMKQYFQNIQERGELLNTQGITDLEAKLLAPLDNVG
jgi:hypothetical protein